MCFFFAIFSTSIALKAQDLAPRAYIITPIHSNAVTLATSFLSGNIVFDGTIPITDATAQANISVISYVHSFRFFGRTANFLAAIPYGVGSFHGKVLANETNVYRSGLLPCSLRFSVNIKGGPAMDLEEFRKWRQKSIIGVSLKVLPPTGQYDPSKLINYGTNRWAFKPEIGLSERWGHWVLDAYGGAWFFTTNPEFFSRNQYNPNVMSQSQEPIGAFEGHLSYDVKPRLWASLDGNFWFGGVTSLNGNENPGTYDRNSRVGVTVSVPVSKRQSFKFSYSRGAYIRYGGDYQNISLAWQYSWLGRPK
jgi:hypothetical protein